MIYDVTHKGEKLVLYNFQIHRYPAHSRIAAQADCDVGLELLETYKKNPSDINFEALKWFHDFLGATYFGRKQASERIEMPIEMFREFDQARKRASKDANVFAKSLDDEFTTNQIDDVPKLGEYANSRIAEQMDAHKESVLKSKQNGAAKARVLKQKKKSTDKERLK